MKYGIFGGSFDPPHLGHINIARAAIEHLGLDEVIWVPAFQNPLKSAISSEGAKRLEMCRLAIEGEPNMSVSDIDLSRKGASYLIDTLTELKLFIPGDYWFIAGADAMNNFDNWKDTDRILQHCRVALMSRPGNDFQTTLGRLGNDMTRHIDIVETTPKAISSSNIRDMVFKGEAVEHNLAPAVHDYIIKTGLYKN